MLRSSKSKFWFCMIVGLTFSGIAQILTVGSLLYYWLLIIGIVLMFVSIFFLVKSGIENILGFIRYIWLKIKGD